MCHDVAFITSHGLHGNGALSAWTSVATAVTGGPSEAGAADSVEMNCFLYHTGNPANDKRIEALNAGTPEWAASATLANTRAISWNGTGWIWNQDAFSSNGSVRGSVFTVRSPMTENCAQCHGVASDALEPPVSLDAIVPGANTTLTTGEIFSPQLISNSAIAVSGEELPARSWDVHAERGLTCTDCHRALNNPAYRTEAKDTAGVGLLYDPRNTTIGEYLRRPNHNFGGQSELSDLSCVRCHDPKPSHEWLPYSRRHMAKLACEACHTPRMYSPAAESVDWTSLSEGSVVERPPLATDLQGLGRCCCRTGVLMVKHVSHHSMQSRRGIGSLDMQGGECRSRCCSIPIVSAASMILESWPTLSFIASRTVLQVKHGPRASAGTVIVPNPT